MTIVLEKASKVLIYHSYSYALMKLTDLLVNSMDSLLGSVSANSLDFSNLHLVQCC